jgi:hypothetical protein
MKYLCISIFMAYAINISSIIAQPMADARIAKVVPISPVSEPEYVIKTEKVLVRPAYTLNEVVEPKWTTVRDRILVSPAYPEGSTFNLIKERIRLKDPYLTVVVTPPVWEAVTKTIVIQTACKGGAQETKTYTYNNLITPALVEETKTLGEYKFVERKMIEKLGTGAMIPAEYIEVDRQTPTTTVLHKVSTAPAEYQMFEVRLCK